MNHIILVILFAIMTATAQETYRQHIRNANQLYRDKAYLKSAESFEKAFHMNAEKPKLKESKMYHYYNAACSWALSGNKDKAFEHLDHIASSELYTNLDQIKNDTDFNTLKEDPRWNRLLEKIQTNREAATPLSNDELMAIFKAYTQAKNSVFRKGSTPEDVDKLYAFYTADFIYDHPGYGGEYSREHLYTNTLRFQKQGRYADNKPRILKRVLFGKSSLVVEEENADTKKIYICIIKFKKDKIYYIEELW